MSEYKLILCDNFQSKITGFVKMIGLEKFTLKSNIMVLENILKTKVNGNNYTYRYNDTYISFRADMLLKKSGKINCSITNVDQNVSKFHSFHELQEQFSKSFKGEIVVPLQGMYKRPSFYGSQFSIMKIKIAEWLDDELQCEEDETDPFDSSI